MTKTEASLSAPIKIGNTTIHRVVEQEGPFFVASQFFPTITKELLDENRGWLRPRFLDDEEAGGGAEFRDGPGMGGLPRLAPEQTKRSLRQRPRPLLSEIYAC